MQIGAEDPPGHSALGAITVANAEHHSRQGRNAASQAGDALVVLEPGQPVHSQRGVDVGHDLANPAPLAPATTNIEDAEPFDRLAVGAAEDGSDELVARAHREYDRTPVSYRRQAAVSPKPLHGEYLGQVFSAA